MAKDARGHGSAGGGGMSNYLSGALHFFGQRDAAAQTLSGDHPKSGVVPIHGGMSQATYVLGQHYGAYHSEL